MTVGIAAICDGTEDESRGVVVAADRLVTTGYGTRIEYEHTDTKITEITDAGSVTCFAVASGSLSLADDLFLKMEEEIAERGPTTIRDIAQEGVDAFHRLQRETFTNQILAPLDLELEDLRKGDISLSKEYQRALLQDIYEKKEEIEKNLSILLAGVDANGAHIYSLTDADIARHDNLGYATIGSGSLSSQLTFTRNRYDTDCSLSDGLMTVVEAKARAEEAQGVGRKMDIVLIKDDDVEFVKGDDVEPLRELQQKIETAEMSAREKTIEQSDIEYLDR